MLRPASLTHLCRLPPPLLLLPFLLSLLLHLRLFFLLLLLILFLLFKLLEFLPQCLACGLPLLIDNLCPSFCVVLLSGRLVCGFLPCFGRLGIDG